MEDLSTSIAAALENDIAAEAEAEQQYKQITGEIASTIKNV
jgi:rubrerythrin